jgi:hypothetical protein
LRQKVDTRTTVVDAPPSQVFAPIRQIGGPNGWYFGNSSGERDTGWTSLFGGVGMGRGRRDPENCALTDVIDGWTVDAYEPDRRLRLRADLKLPGRGWLEFRSRRSTTAGDRSSARRRRSTLEACWAGCTGTPSCRCTSGCSAVSCVRSRVAPSYANRDQRRPPPVAFGWLRERPAARSKRVTRR